MDELLRHRLQHVPLDDRVRQVDQFQPELFGQHGEEDFFLDEALIDEHLVGREVRGGFEGFVRAGALTFRKQTAGNKRLDQLHDDPVNPGVTSGDKQRTEGVSDVV